MPQRHRGPLPIPTEELVRIQGSLDPYQSTLWEGQGVRLFIARVPDADPDLVNDLERIAELAQASHVASADGALLLAPKNVHTVPLDPLRRLLEDRVRFDADQARKLRLEIPGASGVRLYRGLDDPKRRLRLAIVIAQEQVADLDDDDLLDAAEALGDALATGLRDVHCIYLIASRDHVRLNPQDLLPELVEQWNDPARRERLAQEQLEAQMAAEQERQAAKQQLDEELKARFERVVVAPVRSMEPDAPVRRSPSDVQAKVDALEERIRAANATVQTIRGNPLETLATRMETLGYAVRLEPRVRGHRIDLAAERPQGPARVVVIQGDDARAAKQLREAVHALGADLGLLVSSRLDSGAQRALGRNLQWVQPNDIAQLVL